jgi:hypothetical protein
LQTKGDIMVTVDGVRQPENAILLVDDRQNHSAEVRVGQVPGLPRVGI